MTEKKSLVPIALLGVGAIAAAAFLSKKTDVKSKIDIQVEPKIYGYGDQIVVRVGMRNNSNEGHNYKLGVSIGKDGIKWFDVGHYIDGFGDFRTFTFQPFEEFRGTRTLRIPNTQESRDLPTDWDVFVTIRDEQNNVLASEKAFNVIILIPEIPAGKGTAKFIISDKIRNIPVENARITEFSESFEIFTDQNGVAKIDLDPGSYTVFIRKDNFKTRQTNFNITNQGVTLIQQELTPKDINEPINVQIVAYGEECSFQGCPLLNGTVEVLETGEIEPTNQPFGAEFVLERDRTYTFRVRGEGHITKDFVELVNPFRSIFKFILKKL